jgi:hypothetical protein
MTEECRQWLRLVQRSSTIEESTNQSIHNNENKNKNKNKN